MNFNGKVQSIPGCLDNGKPCKYPQDSAPEMWGTFPNDVCILGRKLKGTGEGEGEGEIALFSAKSWDRRSS